jgi:maltooligosyltrehalose trehalohydrolase
LVGFEALKLIAGAELLSPYLPLLFMGEEWGETAPFQYFVSHSDEALIHAVREGRKKEFAAFKWAGEVPDPQSEETFRRSKLDWTRPSSDRGAALLAFYAETIRLRTSFEPLADLNKETLETGVLDAHNLLWMRRWRKNKEALVLLHFGKEKAAFRFSAPPGPWKKRLDSADKRWSGPGAILADRLSGGPDVPLDLAPTSVAVFVKE